MIRAETALFDPVTLMGTHDHELVTAMFCDLFLG